LILLNQQALPEKLEYLEYTDYRKVIGAIKDLTVRGAPAIGVAAAYALSLASAEFLESVGKGYFKLMKKASEEIADARPTAVNLRWAVERITGLIKENADKPAEEIDKLVVREAKTIEREDVELCQKIGEYGAGLINNGDGVLTHCNAGALATAGIGTALGVIYTAAFSGKNIRIYSGETRPVDQGRRLTVWELAASGLDVALICDNMVASLLSAGKVDKVIVGADRIALNGDTANKIGTLNIAIIAKNYGVPFYVAAPYSTFDKRAKDGNDIPIEFRSGKEIVNKEKYEGIKGRIDVYNPAFDITPSDLISGFITDKGILNAGDISAKFV